MEEERRMQNAVNDTLNYIDRKCLRTLQVNSLYLLKKKKVKHQKLMLSLCENMFTDVIIYNKFYNVMSTS